MVVVFGASGFAFECFEVWHANGGNLDEIHFFDDVSDNLPPIIEQFGLVVHRSLEDLKKHFPNGFEAIIGAGNPKVRRLLMNKIRQAGGKPVSLISQESRIGYLGNSIGLGCCIMTGVVVTSNCKIEDGVLLNLAVTIGHDCLIGEFTEICPGVNISGKCIIGKDVFIGTGAILLPGIEIGDGSVIAAGSMVSKNVKPKTMVAGNPAVWKKDL